MNRFSSLAGLFLVLLACHLGAESGNRSGDIFRYVTTDLGTIKLGQPWKVMVPGAGPSDTVVALPAGTFGGARAIRVHRTAAGVVKAVMFDYPQSANFSTMVAEYTDLLGPPGQHDRTTDVEAPERIAWQDSATRFELTRDPRRSASTIYSVLTDRRTGH